jgi:hypothetical protein
MIHGGRGKKREPEHGDKLADVDRRSGLVV